MPITTTVPACAHAGRGNQATSPQVVVVATNTASAAMREGASGVRTVCRSVTTLLRTTHVARVNQPNG